MVELLVNLLAICAILGILWWAIQAIPMPPPFGIIVRVVFAIIAIVLLLGMLDVVPQLHLYHHRLR